MRSFEHFYLVEHQPRQWLIYHQVTDEPAGLVRRTPAGYHLADENGAALGTVASLDDAIVGLYAVA